MEADKEELPRTKSMKASLDQKYFNPMDNPLDFNPIFLKAIDFLNLGFIKASFFKTSLIQTRLVQTSLGQASLGQASLFFLKAIDFEKIKLIAVFSLFMYDDFGDTRAVALSSCPRLKKKERLLWGFLKHHS